MQNYAYSASRVRAFDTCPAMYKEKYIKKTSAPVNDAHEFGILAHKVMEKYLRHLTIQGKTRDTVFAEELFVKALAKALNPDQEQSVRDVLQPQSIVHHGEQVLSGSSWAIEKESAYTANWTPTSWYGVDVRWRAKMDLTQINCWGQLEITDFKTSYRMPPHDEITGDFQLWSYAATAARDYPDVAEIVVQLYFLRYRKTKGFTIQRSDALEYLKVIEEKCGWIDGESAWAPRVGTHCGYCPFTSQCHDFQCCPDVHGIVPDAGNVTTWAEELVKGEIQVKALKAGLKAWIDEYGPVVLNGKQYGFVAQEKLFCDQPEALLEFMTDSARGKVKDFDPWSTVTISKAKAERALKKAGQKTAMEDLDTFFKSRTDTTLKWHAAPKEVETDE